MKIFFTALCVSLVALTAQAGKVDLTPGGKYTSNDGTEITCSGGGTEGVVMLVQYYDWNARQELIKSCDGTLSQIRCETIRESSGAGIDTICSGLCHLKN